MDSKYLSAGLCLLSTIALTCLTCLAQDETAAPAAPSRPHPDISRLGKFPDWSRLDAFQRTMTRTEFVYLLDHCYTNSPSKYEGLIDIHEDRAEIVRQSNYSAAGKYTLYFKSSPEDPGDADTYWRDTYQMDDLPEGSAKVLDGIRIAVDPGHIGGEWVRWDDRHFKIGSHSTEVREGELTLKVAKILERDLTTLGAEVFLTRSKNEPVTTDRADDMVEAARAHILRKKKIPSKNYLAYTAGRFFALSSEMRARAELVNNEFQPDLLICLHFNATPWGRTAYFNSANHMHLLVNGCYTNGEVKEDDVRFDMLYRLLQRMYYPELEMSEAVAQAMRTETSLPAFKGYTNGSGKRVCDDPYIYARNLLGNRLFMCPVVFLEPYCMNNRTVYYRIQAGEYEGMKEFGGRMRKNIFQEYADGITNGLVDYFEARR